MNSTITWEGNVLTRPINVQWLKYDYLSLKIIMDVSDCSNGLFRSWGFVFLFFCFGLYSYMELFLAEPHGSRNQAQFKKSCFGEILSWKKWMLPSVATEADLAHFEMWKNRHCHVSNYLNVPLKVQMAVMKMDSERKGKWDEKWKQIENSWIIENDFDTCIREIVKG